MKKSLQLVGIQSIVEVLQRLVEMAWDEAFISQQHLPAIRVCINLHEFRFDLTNDGYIQRFQPVPFVGSWGLLRQCVAGVAECRKSLV
mmetsp:Transcript_5445/g.7883  ORF Transcript_5445/g.7883 Transcript_5445/m.7883 type:complete len:88 (+) Transcript_5445:1087-1350(+)